MMLLVIFSSMRLSLKQNMDRACSGVLLSFWISFICFHFYHKAIYSHLSFHNNRNLKPLLDNPQWHMKASQVRFLPFSHPWKVNKTLRTNLILILVRLGVFNSMDENRRFFVLELEGHCKSWWMWWIFLHSYLQM